MPHSSDQDSKVAFFHIPKTGGMTFGGVLQSMFGDSFAACSDPSIDAVASALQKFDCLEFHVHPYKGRLPYMHSELAAKNRWDLLERREIFTMLRDPVEQSLSLYFQLVESRPLLEQTCYKPFGIPFPESLEEFVEMPWHMNTQSHFLLGHNNKPTFDFVSEDLARVKDWLVKLKVHVGLTERYADSLHVLEKVTGRNVDEYKVERRQVNKNRLRSEQIPETVKDKIRSQSHRDLELYEFARERFEEDFREYGKGPVYTFTSGVFIGHYDSEEHNTRTVASSPWRKVHIRVVVLTIQCICYLRRTFLKSC